MVNCMRHAIVCGFVLLASVTFAGAFCGDGSADGGEQCDDGNLLPDDCCSPACTFESISTSCAADGNPCTDDFCDGAGNCGIDNTASCNDGDACTDGDTCSGGACMPGGTPVDCDDDDGCTRDSCDAMLGCRNVAEPLPLSACFVSSKAQLLLKASTAEKNLVKWVWSKGEALAQTGLGAPDSNTTYSFCLFDTAVSAPVLKADIDIDPGALWVSKAPKGWNYVNKEATPRGVKKLLLRTGLTGKTKALFQAGGAT